MPVVFFLCLLAAKLPAQDSNSLGPHGGYLKTLGDFHSELVLNAQKGAVVYLLNREDKNPISDKASVYFLLRSGRFEANYYCAPKEDHFECRMPKPLDRKPGDIVTIKAMRKGKTDHFRYEFPLAP